MNMPAIDFWYDFASPYSYVAAERIEGAARVAGVAVRWHPFLVGPIFDAQGWTTSPFNLYPAKGANMWRDVERICARYALLWRRPSMLPRDGTLAARVALVGAGEGWIANFTRAVYRANFVEDRDLADPAAIADILARLGLASAVLDRASSPEIGAKLHANAGEAVARGFHGAPTFIVEDELFWGSDRLDQALEWAKAPWL